ncbi:MAG: GerW family sporulation protein [bacterium]|nr:GerW family sporulation protein [bacterium]
MAENDFKTEITSMFQGMDSFVSSKTVVGEPIYAGDAILLPLIDISFGMGVGSFCDNAKKNNGGGGIGAKMTPSAVLVIQNGMTKMVSVKNQDTVTKILDLVPDVVNKVMGVKNDSITPEAMKTAEDVLKDAKTTTEKMD